MKKFKNKNEMIAWGPKIGEVYNQSFINNWEYYPLTPKEIKFSIDNVLLVALPEFIKLIMHENDIIGFLFIFPDISAAMQRHGGHLYPWALLDFMLEMKRTKWISLNGVGVLQEYHAVHGKRSIPAQRRFYPCRTNPDGGHCDPGAQGYGNAWRPNL